jgi:tRNA nucleotidyltransferase (CCA-adding enzyme)
LNDQDWANVVDADAFLFEATRPTERSHLAGLPRERPERVSTAMALLERASALQLAMARIGGVEWLDQWARDWRKVGLEISGEDLMEEGVAQGPAVGRGLQAALAARLDGEISTREEELRVALAAAAET